MNDIFEGWKKERFVVAGPNLHDYTNHYLVIMTDFGYWTDHADQCTQWCLDHGCEQTGATILIPTDELLTAFCLRWR